jgi:acyl-CoA reductase-like NAD-dependent aldehyde dehydrogenase
MHELKNYINGQWVPAESGKTARTTNPANWDEVVSEYPLASKADAQRAIEAACAAQPAWGALPPPSAGPSSKKPARSSTRALDETAAALTREEGKTLAESKGEVLRARDILQATSRAKAGGWAEKPIPTMPQ